MDYQCPVCKALVDRPVPSQIIRPKGDIKDIARTVERALALRWSEVTLERPVMPEWNTIHRILCAYDSGRLKMPPSDEEILAVLNHPDPTTL